MRTYLFRASVGSALAGLLAFFVGPTPSLAAQEGEIDHAAEECIELLEAGKSIDACQEAPNLLLPPTNELIWGSIAFAVLLLLLYKFAWPSMKQSLDARTEQIRSDLEAAEQAKTEAEGVLANYQRQLADARNESARIIGEARQQADVMRRDLTTRAQAEIVELRQREAADVESAKQRALADLRAEVVEIALGAAQTVVHRSLDRETSERLVEDYINSVASRS